MQVLNSLAAAGGISSDVCSTSQQHYQALHSALAAAMGREQALLEDARKLEQRKELEEETEIENLKDLASDAAMEARNAELKVEDAEAQLRELTSHHVYFSKRAEQMQTDHAAAVYPVVRRLEEDIRNLLKSLDNERTRVKACQADVNATNDQIVKVRANDIRYCQAAAAYCQPCFQRVVCAGLQLRPNPKSLTLHKAPQESQGKPSALYPFSL